MTLAADMIRLAAGEGPCSRPSRELLCKTLLLLDEDALHFLLGAVQYEAKRRGSDMRNALAEADAWVMMREYATRGSEEER